MSDAVLILGAAAVQMPLIRYVKSRGYRTIVVSIPGNYPGFKIADRCVYCDVRDGETILSQISDERIVAVLTDQTDLSVPTVAYLSSRLGLRGNKYETAQIYSNKFLMRQTCDKVGLDNPKYLRISSTHEAKEWSVYPAIIKPEDNQGSRGIRLISSYNELCAVLPSALSFSRTGYAIIEEFFEGNEVVVEGFVHNGQYLNWGIGDRKYFKLDRLFIPSQTIFPTNLSEDIVNKLLLAEKKLHACLNPSFGMVHSEYLVNQETGEIRLVETALRGGGVYISSHLIPLYCGYNNYELLLDFALGKHVDLTNVESQLRKKASAYICFYLPEGEIISIEGMDELSDMPGVVMADIANLHIGSRTELINNKTQRLGPILVTANTRLEIDKLINKVQQTYYVKVKCLNENIAGIRWI